MRRVSLRGLAPLPEVVVMTLTVGPTAVLHCARASDWRRSPQSLCLSVRHLNRAVDSLPSRDGIRFGCVVGVLTARLVLPDRARAAIKTGAASVLDALGKVAERGRG